MKSQIKLRRPEEPGGNISKIEKKSIA